IELLDLLEGGVAGCERGVAGRERGVAGDEVHMDLPSLHDAAHLHLAPPGERLERLLVVRVEIKGNRPRILVGHRSLLSSLDAAPRGHRAPAGRQFREPRSTLSIGPTAPAHTPCVALTAACASGAPYGRRTRVCHKTISPRCGCRGTPRRGARSFRAPRRT